MRPYVRRLAAASAAAYLLAGWLAAGLHSHGHQHAHAEKAAGVCTTCSCGHHHGPKGHEHDQESSHCPDEPVCPEEDCHHCPVCDFLAKPPVAVAAVTLQAAPEPAAEAAEPPAPTFEPVSLFVCRSRGPPVA